MTATAWPNAHAESRCLHCGADVAAGSRFCCAGCEAVHSALHDADLGDYYRLRRLDEAGLEGVAASPREAVEHAFFDSDSFREGHCRVAVAGAAVADTTYATRLAIDGMTCVACTWLVEQVGARTTGVTAARADLLRRSLEIRFRGDAALGTLARELGRFGYGVRLAQDHDAGDRDLRRRLLHVAVAGAAAANIMLLSLPFYSGLAQGAYAGLFGWVAMALATVVLVVPARPILHGAWRATRAGRVSLDLPLALGLLAAYSTSTVQLMRGRYDGVFYDSMAMLAFAVLVGRFLHARAVDRARARVALLAAKVPELVQAWRDGTWRSIPSEAVRVGDRLRLEPGATTPAECVLLGAATEVDLAVVSGEARPRRVAVGATLPAGARVLEAAMEVRVERIAVELPQADAGSQQVTGGRLAARLARWWTAAVLVAATAGMLLWLPHGWQRGLEVAMIVLIVACPCALGLAAPVVAALATALAARRGVLVRSPDLVDRLVDVCAVVLDKTGTVTEGQPGVASVETFGMADAAAPILGALAAIEAPSRQPIAKAIAREFEGYGGVRPGPGKVHSEAIAGAGVRGRIDDLEIEALAPRASPDGSAPVGAIAAARTAEVQARGETTVCVWARETRTVPWRLVAIVGLRDRLRADARATIEVLRGRDLRLVLLSGDHRHAVDEAADALGIAERYADADPEAKRARIEVLAAVGPVIMVGDGLNDIAALEGSAIAIAPGSASSGAIAVSDVVLHGHGIGGLAVLFEIADRSRRVVLGDVFFALLYNVVGVSLALTGQLTPLVAALMMPLSSLTVVSFSIHAMWRHRTAPRPPMTPR